MIMFVDIVVNKHDTLEMRQMNAAAANGTFSGIVRSFHLTNAGQTLQTKQVSAFGHDRPITLRLISCRYRCCVVVNVIKGFKTTRAFVHLRFVLHYLNARHQVFQGCFLLLLLLLLRSFLTGTIEVHERRAQQIWEIMWWGLILRLLWNAVVVISGFHQDEIHQLLFLFLNQFLHFVHQASASTTPPLGRFQPLHRLVQIALQTGPTVRKPKAQMVHGFGMLSFTGCLYHPIISLPRVLTDPVAVLVAQSQLTLRFDMAPMGRQGIVMSGLFQVLFGIPVESMFVSVAFAQPIQRMFVVLKGRLSPPTDRRFAICTGTVNAMAAFVIALPQAILSMRVVFECSFVEPLSDLAIAKADCLHGR
mmetsp:Transcript_10541/g.23337  ORF Transcript_10541/g.23337 Transcript_10541/m.23337 type:complete len:362 (+) Transcript_10541:153-1238(+)